MGGSFTSPLPPPPLPPPRARSMKDLPTDVMISVLDRLSIVDRIRFGSVCSSFYSIFRAAQRLPLSKTPPWMLLPSQSTSAALAFFSISDGRIYRIPQKGEEEGSSRSRHCCRLLFLGSSDGWLVTLDQGCSQIYLLNPITGTKIHLPPLPSSKLVPLESSKAILSFNSSSSSYTVVLLLARHPSSSFAWPTALVTCCTQQAAWTPLGRREFYSDAAISSSTNLLYAMQSNGTVEAWDLSAGGPSLSTTFVMPKSVSTGFASFTKYLVKDGGGGGRGGLLQAWRSREFAKVEFKVFELLEEEEGEWEWVEVKSLDGRVVFLNSCCSSMSMMSEDCPPELLGGGGANNSIYFDCLASAASSSKNRESMVFRMGDGSVERVLLHGSIWEPSPIWIAPTLLGTDCSGGQ